MRWLSGYLSGKKGCQAANCQKNLAVGINAWLWKAKIQEAMKSSGKHALSGNVKVDEFLVGGFSEGEPGRTHGSKDLVVLAIEKVKDKKGQITIGRAYCRVVDDAHQPIASKKIFDEHVAPQASVKTDGWRGYWPLGKDWMITQENSDKGAGFPMLHIHVMNIKGWLRGVHHKCETHRLQQYLDEHHFRFNRRGFLNSIFDNLVTRMTGAKPVNYKMINCELNT